MARLGDNKSAGGSSVVETGTHEPTIADKFGAISLGLGSDDNSGGVVSGEFDPDVHVGRDKRNADGSYTRKRGRRAGSGGGRVAAAKKNPSSVNTIETALVGIHLLLAAATKADELVLEPDESKPLAEAIAELTKHYDIPGLDAKAMAWVGLIMVAGKVYVPRAMLIKARLDEEAEIKTPPKPSIVVDNTKEKKDAATRGVEADGFYFDPLNPPTM